MKQTLHKDTTSRKSYYDLEERAFRFAGRVREFTKSCLWQLKTLRI